MTDFVTVFIALGFVLNILAKGKKLKYSGQIMMGFGIMMLGMQMMGNSVAPLRKYQGFVDFIVRRTEIKEQVSRAVKLLIHEFH